jgi:hypothetical protein
VSPELAGVLHSQTICGRQGRGIGFSRAISEAESRPVKRPAAKASSKKVRRVDAIGNLPPPPSASRQKGRDGQLPCWAELLLAKVLSLTLNLPALNRSAEPGPWSLRTRTLAPRRCPVSRAWGPLAEKSYCGKKEIKY